MKFFYNPDLSSPLTDKEQEDVYCDLRNNTKKYVNISVDKRVYSIQVPINGILDKYTVGDNAIAIFESIEWIQPRSYFVINDNKAFLIKPSNNFKKIPDIKVEYFE